MAEIGKGIYGLPQTKILANIRLQKHSHEHGYVVVSHIIGLFRHVTQLISFTPVVDGLVLNMSTNIIGVIFCIFSSLKIISHQIYQVLFTLI